MFIKCHICGGLRSGVIRIGAGEPLEGHFRLEGWQNSGGTWTCPDCLDVFSIESLYPAGRETEKTAERIKEFKADLDSSTQKAAELKARLDAELLDLEYEQAQKIKFEIEKAERRGQLAKEKAEKLQAAFIENIRADCLEYVNAKRAEREAVGAKIEAIRQKKEKIRQDLNAIEAESAALTMQGGHLAESIRDLESLVS